MSRRAEASSAHVARIVAGAIKGGLPAGSFIVEVVDGIVRLLPVRGASAVTSSDSDDWSEALDQWRRSA